MPRAINISCLFTKFTIFAACTLLVPLASAHEGRPSGRSLLNTEVEALSLSPAAKSEAFQLIGQADGFGVRLRDVLRLKPEHISSEWNTYLTRRHLAFGLSEAELMEYAEFGFIERLRFTSPAEAQAYAKLSWRALAVLHTLGEPNAEVLARLYTLKSLKGVGAGTATGEELAAYVRSAGFELRSGGPPSAHPFLRYSRFEQYNRELNLRARGEHHWGVCSDWLD